MNRLSLREKALSSVIVPWVRGHNGRVQSVLYRGHREKSTECSRSPSGGYRITRRRLLSLHVVAVMLLMLGSACAVQQPSHVATIPDEKGLQGRLQEQPKGPSYTVPQLALGPDGSINLMWLTVESGNGREFLFTRSDNLGATWSRPLPLNPDTGAVAGGFRIATSPAGAIYVVWQQWDQTTKARQLRFLRSTDKGVHWDDLFQGLKRLPDMSLPRLVADQDGGRSIAWLAWEKDHGTLEVVRAPDPGAAQLPTPIRLNAPFPAPRYSIIAHRFTSDGKGAFYVIWEEIKAANDYRIYLNRSVDRGKTWAEQPILVSAAEDREHMAHAPEILALPDGRVYVVWEQHEFRPGRHYVPGEVMKPDRLIYVNRSLDYGQSWLPRPVRVGEIHEGLVLASDAQMSADRRGHLYVTWVEGDTKRERLFVARSTDAGLTWSTPIRLDLTSPFTGHFGLPEIQSDDAGQVWVVWQELIEQKTWVLLMNRSTDYGQTWQAQATVLAGPRHGGGSSRGVTFQHDGAGRLYVVWDGGVANDREIYVTRSADFGATWSPQERIAGLTTGS